MTNQSQLLTFKLSNGQEVALPNAKSVLQFTDKEQQRSCAIVQGPNGVAVYNADGDIQINGAPSSAHWLQVGDELQFGPNMTASVTQLGKTEQAIASLLQEPALTSAPIVVDPEEAPVQEAPVQVVNAQDTFTPATAATAFTVQPQAAAPAATPVVAAVPELPATPVTPAASVAPTPEPAPTQAPTQTDFTTPAVTAAALAATAISVAGAANAAPQTPVVAEAPVGSTGFNPLTPAHEVAAPIAETPAPEAPTPETPALETPATQAPTNQPEISGFAAELLARIQADENENETVGTPTSETTHSQLAADGSSFSSPTIDDSASISSLIPELPPTSIPTPPTPAEPDVEPTSATVAPIETTTTESSERQQQSSSVSALLERMKSEGQWEGISEEEEVQQEEQSSAANAAPPVADEADDDVQSYMSQLLSRMRGPGEEAPAPVAVQAPKPQQTQPTQEFVEPPKPVGLLKPEEFVPKTKPRRLDSLQEMRALANTQTQSAINRSIAKRREAFLDHFNLTIAITSCILAALVFFFNIFGGMSFAVGMIAMIAGAFFCCKTYFSELVAAKKPKSAAARPTAAPDEAV